MPGPQARKLTVCTLVVDVELDSHSDSTSGSVKRHNLCIVEHCVGLYLEYYDLQHGM